MEREIKTRKRSKKLGINGLSTLEADIMNIVWKQKKITVREVHETMLEEGYIPYTTVMAAMNNMSQKGLLKQNKNGKAYVYSAAISRDSMAKSIVDTVVTKILGGTATPLVSHLLKLKSDNDYEKLIELKNKLDKE
ncbi:MAG: BlaI/MecI/CopY family transcriptional regulator [Rubrobacteridae bacterium]|nr:BlaI/MecI/CopY family transcriptional regulator [Rubrobacteridae bacterium]